MAGIDEAKDIIKNTPISSIIQNYIAINKKGSTYEAVCPFHSDSHPSLKISDSKGIYKCFACGAVGDSIAFVRNKLNLSFVDAVKEIGDKIGITIKEEKKQNPKLELALRILRLSNKIYLKVATEVSPTIYKDFIKKRNISEESIRDFQIGFAPSNNAILNYIKSIKDKDQKNIQNTALELGIIRENKSGGLYDFFRSRVTFPIWDHSGKVRGYSTRSVLPDQKPKYLNSGESFIFDKKNILYAFHLAKKAIREKDSAIIVEGNMDALALHQFGFKNSVATMGVALSENSVKLLTNMTSNIYLGMDSDPAGLIAMKKINSMFLRVGVHPKFIDYSPAKDPDEYLQEFGRLSLVEKIEKAPLFVDYLCDEILQGSKLSTTDQKLAALNQFFQAISPAKNNLWAYEKISHFATKLGISSSNEDIINAFKEYKQQNKPLVSFQAEIEQSSITTQEDGPAQVELETKLESPIPIIKFHRNLLIAVFSNPEIIESPQITEILDLIDHFEVKMIVQWLQEIYLEIDESDYLHFLKNKMQENLPREIKEVLNTVILNYKKEQKLSEKIINKMLLDFKHHLQLEKLLSQKNKIKVLRSKSISEEESLVYLKQIQQIENDISNIKKL